MNVMSRAAVLLGVVASLAIVGPMPALAKMPPFGLYVTVEGDTALIRVSFSFDSSAGFHPADLDNLLAVYPSNDLNEALRPLRHDNSIPVDLEWVDEFGWYEGRLQLEEAGSFLVVPFPTSIWFDAGSASHREYPTSVGFQIQADSTSEGLLIGGALLLFILGRGARRMSNRRLDSSTGV